MKKLVKLYIYIVLVVTAFSVTTAFAVSNESETGEPNNVHNLVASQPFADESSNMTYSGDTIGIASFDVQLILPVNQKGKAAYTGQFTTTPTDGKYLNVYSKNNGPGTVYMTIKRNSQEFVSDIAIASGSQRTQTFEEQVNVGLSGDWEVYIYTKDGHEMDLQVSARQY